MDNSRGVNRDPIVLFSEFSFATTAGHEAIKSISRDQTSKVYQSDHPWQLAREILTTEQEHSRSVPFLLASGNPLQWDRWGVVLDIEVVGWTGGRWETHIQFSDLNPFPAMFLDLDSVMLKPSDELLYRESIEPIRVIRQHVDQHSIYPYAICLTPPFILKDQLSTDESTDL